MNAWNSQNEQRTLKDLTPNVEALLCYVGGWISGIIFLVLEQKSHTIRFHALQSIIVFGALSVAMAVFGAVPVIGGGFAGALGLIAFILWIILLVKAISGDYLKVPWVGDLAEKLANNSFGLPTRANTSEEKIIVETATSEQPNAGDVPREEAPHKEKISNAADFKARYYSGGARAARITGSAFAIAWCVVLLVFFNFYNQYIAYYEPMHNGSTNWRMHTLVTSDFRLWLPILSTTLVLSIVGHAVLIAVDMYFLRKIFRIIMDGFGAATVIWLLFLFPFDFNAIPNQIGADAASFGVRVALVLISIGLIIGAIVKFIQLIVHLVQGKF